MQSFRYLTFVAVLAVAIAQDFDYDSPRPAPPRVRPNYSGPAPSAPRPTPVAILKQINRHNDDGSYTYGYESADGTFKIETKLPTGEVKGKYGYIDDTGKVRTIEYGATKYGFEPSGEGITVAPPTLVDETTNRDGTLAADYAGSYYEEPQQPQRAAPRPRPQQHQQHQQQPQFDFGGPQQFSAPQRSAAPVPQRASVAGAAPASTTHNFDFGPSPVQHARPASRNFAPQPPKYSRPAPIEEQYAEPEPVRAAPPRITYAQPAARPQEPQFAPAARPAPQYSPRPAPAAPAGRGGILDQLSKDYALPQSAGQAVHDISFGYY